MHYMTLIQQARHTAENLVELREQLPADLIERQATTARAKLTETAGKGGKIADEMRARAETALTSLGF